MDEIILRKGFKFNLVRLVTLIEKKYVINSTLNYIIFEIIWSYTQEKKGIIYCDIKMY